MSFAQLLIEWYSFNGRDLPWRHTDDPYIIWLSEIILQQTRVEQGRPYFFQFSENFPTVDDFASANEEDILRLWQGLGYYSRARNMHKAAKVVVSAFGGQFPTKYSDLITLPGVGDYTAAAISSFSVNEDQAVLDGNVFRVLARFFGIEEAINSTNGKKLFKILAQEMLPLGQAGVYNQAIMDFGAMLCKPKSPLCDNCVLMDGCVAFREKTISDLPRKQKGKVSKDRFFHYFIVENENGVMMSKRGEGDVWANMYEFPMLESDTDVGIDELVKFSEFQLYFQGATLEVDGVQIKHVLSHQNIYARFYRIVGGFLFGEKKYNWNYCLLENLDKLAKHKLIFTYIDKYMLTN